MESDHPPGTEGYAEKARTLVANWENVSFADKHKSILHLIPSISSKVLDIGSGAGGDAAALEKMGHSVVAVEPVDELRLAAIALHSSPRIEWLKDSLPDLSFLLSRRETFDLVMLTAVWMHLDPAERQRAMGNLATLIRDGGTILISLRHGPVPPERRMFDVSSVETRELAVAHGLHCLLEQESQSVQEANRRSGVRWTQLAFRKNSEG